MKALVKSLKNDLITLRDDEQGAAMIEYSILIGLITVTIIAAIAFVGGWVADAWAALEAVLTANPAPAG